MRVRLQEVRPIRHGNTHNKTRGKCRDSRGHGKGRESGRV